MTADLPGQDDGAEDLPALPEAVRSRLIALTADVLPQVVDLPSALRTVAGFAPRRRGRLGANQIATELARDPEFRVHVHTQLLVREPVLAAVAQEAPSAAEPIDVAAMAWLVRFESWQEVYAAALSRLAERDAAGTVDQQVRELDAARARAHRAEAALEQAQEAESSRMAELKRENVQLRQRLGEARRTAREATDRAEAAQTAAERSGAAVGTADAEVRRLATRVAELEARASDSRRTERAERDEATLRARMLLDALLEAARGLQRELGLPSVEGTPGARVEARLAEGVGPAAASAPLPIVGAAQLERHLALPRARLIIDGYNVTKAAWPTSTLEAQRHRLVAGLAGLVARTGAETTVVFDAAESDARGYGVTPTGVTVVFSPRDVIADDVIRELVSAEPAGRLVVVVTNDAEIIRDVSAAGARVARSQELSVLLR